MERGTVGDPADPDTEVGPIVNEKQLDEILAGIERGKAEGGTIAAGGERIDDDAYLLAPTVFEGVADDAFLSCEEVFGPVTSLYRFSDLDEALGARTRWSSASRRRSSRATWRTRSGSSNELEAGILHVNSQTAGADVHVPFGGIKGSGFGPHEQGRAAIEFYTEVVTVYTTCDRPSHGRTGRVRGTVPCHGTVTGVPPNAISRGQSHGLGPRGHGER